MKHRSTILRVLPFIACLAIVGAACSEAVHKDLPAAISRVEQMPNLPQPYLMRDWRQVTRDYLDLVLDFDQHGDHLPLASWTDKDHTMVSLPSYVGGPIDAEAINYLAAVVSGSLVGLDMRNFRGQDWVTIGTNFFNADEGVYVNRVHDRTGNSFWYDILPNVLAYQINALYPDDAARDQQAMKSAVAWHEACVALGGKSEPPALPNFDHTGFSLKTMQPEEKGWIEPEAAAGIAWLEYMAWVRFKDPRFLTAADWCLRSLEERPRDQSPLYEVLLPYGALAAARMNAELGRHYDVAKLVQDCFDPHGRPQARPGWGVISDRWNGLDAHGLVGSTTDGEGYAFAMNTFQWVGALAPLARYDTRYAHDIGKWTLNLANAARLFYPNAHDAEHQSSYAWSAAHDRQIGDRVRGNPQMETRCVDGQRRLSDDIRKDRKGKLRVDAIFEARIRPIGKSSKRRPAMKPRLNISGSSTFPRQPNRWLVVDAERIDGGHVGNVFRFSFASHPEGPYTPAFSVSGLGPAQVVALPAALRDKLYRQSAKQRSVGRGRQPGST